MSNTGSAAPTHSVKNTRFSFCGRTDGVASSIFIFFEILSHEDTAKEIVCVKAGRQAERVGARTVAAKNAGHNSLDTLTVSIRQFQ